MATLEEVGELCLPALPLGRLQRRLARVVAAGRRHLDPAAGLAPAREIRTKTECRPVEVRSEKNFARKVEETLRVDTWEVVETRALTPGELQGELHMIDGRAQEG